MRALCILLLALRQDTRNLPISGPFKFTGWRSFLGRVCHGIAVSHARPTRFTGQIVQGIIHNNRYPNIGLSLTLVSILDPVPTARWSLCEYSSSTLQSELEFRLGNHKVTSMVDTFTLSLIFLSLTFVKHTFRLSTHQFASGKIGIIKLIVIIL